MRSKFNVLWVEDQRVQELKEGVEQAVFDEGFLLKAKFASNVDEATEIIKDKNYGDHIDLILMDYDLGSGKPTGDDVIDELRKHFPYKEIIFYTGQYYKELDESVFEKKLQGVFRCSRDELVQTTTQVFNVLIKKTMDINHSRGIILAMACEIDELVKQILTHKFDNNDELRQKTKNHINKYKCEEAKEAKNLHDDFNVEDVNNFSEVRAKDPSNKFLTSSRTIKLLKKILNKDDEREYLAGLNYYLEKCIPRRNDLAHIATIDDENSFVSVLRNRKGQEISREDLKNARKEFLNHIILLEQLKNRL